MKVNFDCLSILVNICLVDDKWQPSVLTVRHPLANLHQSALQPVTPPPLQASSCQHPLMCPRPLPGSSFFPPPVDWQPRMRVTYVSAREHLSLEPSLWLPYGFLLFLSLPPYFPVHPTAVLYIVI